VYRFLTGGLVLVVFLASMAQAAPADAPAPVMAAVPPPLMMEEVLMPETQEVEPGPELLGWIELLGPTDGELAFGLVEEHGLPHSIVRSLIRVESSGDPLAASPTADHGLMQLNDILWPSLAEELGIERPDLYDPEDNMRMGLYHLAYLYGKYLDWDAALTAYNRGETGMLLHLEATGTTRSDYSDKVLGRMEE